MDDIIFHGTPPQEYTGLFGDWWHALKQIGLLMFALYGYTMAKLERINLLLHLGILGFLSWLTHTIIFKGL